MTSRDPGQILAVDNWHEVADFDKLDADFPTGVAAGGEAIGLFLHEGKVHALEDICPHAYAHLSQGFQENGVIECPLHAAQFEVATGKCLNDIGGRDVKCYPTKVEGGRVWVQIKPVTA